MENKQITVPSKTEEIFVGKNRYIVRTFFKENGRETGEQKLMRYIFNRISREMKTPEAL